METTFIAPLGSDNALDCERSGAKAAHLSRLLRAGMPTLPGFVVTTALLERVVGDVARGEDWFDREGWGHDSVREARMQAMLSYPWPHQIRDQLTDAFYAIGAPAAVRSSGTAEDGRERSYAGRYLSLVGVSSETAFLEAVLACLASAFDARVLAYAEEAVPEGRLPGLALVLQRAANPTLAGVCFAAGGDAGAEEVVVEAVQGLGEVLADGAVTPQRYLLDPATGAEESFRPGNQLFARVLVDGVRTDRPTLPAAARLDRRQLAQLARLANQASALFGGPQDIEWIAEGREILLVQSRPLTARVRSLDRWACALRAREYGVGYSEISIRSLNGEGSAIVRGRVTDQIYVPAGDEVNVSCYIDRHQWRALKEEVRLLIRPEAYEDFLDAFAREAESFLGFCRDLATQEWAVSSKADLAHAYRCYQRHARQYCTFIWLTYIAHILVTETVEDVFAAGTESGRLCPEMLRHALSPDDRAEAAITFWEELAAVEPTPAAIADLHARYAWVPCLDLQNEPYSIEAIAEMAKARRAAPAGPTACGDYLDLLTDTERFVVRACRRLSYIKDRRDDYRRKCVYLARSSLFAEIAVRAGVALTDLSYWTEAEVFAFLEGRSHPICASRRRAGFSLQRRDGVTTCLVGEDATVTIAALGLQDSSLNKPGFALGLAVCGGTASGPAKIVRGAADLAKVKHGDVMIAATTHPDYNYVMERTSAVVTNEGGRTCHAAIVCGELNERRLAVGEPGVPCVVGAADATRFFSDGEWVRVDGDKGVVMSCAFAEKVG